MPDAPDIFDQFAHAAHKGKYNYTPPHKLVALDPGNTTGVAIFIDGKLEEVNQIATHPIKAGIVQLEQLLTDDIDVVVYEEYKVYSWKTDDHAWADLHTPKLIGCIHTIAHQQDVRIYDQMAQQAKGFCTDELLKRWNYWPTGLKHGRDAIRHGCYFLLFNLHQHFNKPTGNR
jgi:hypothetical protein